MPYLLHLPFGGIPLSSQIFLQCFDMFDGAMRGIRLVKVLHGSPQRGDLIGPGLTWSNFQKNGRVKQTESCNLAEEVM